MSEDSSDLEAERLILDSTEMLLELMEHEQVSRTELADLLGKTKGHVSQLLNGERNMTLRTLAEVAHALGGRVAVSTAPLNPAARSASKIIEFKNYLRENRVEQRGHSRLARSLSMHGDPKQLDEDIEFDYTMDAAVAS